jgi:hypothetical protein
MIITIPISVGELLDKISILQIKSQFTDSPYVIKEREYLIEIAKENKVYFEDFLSQLLEVNSKLWTLENNLREFEKRHIFNEDFIEDARLVYINNDERARIKKEIDETTNSEMRETKIYK